MVEKIENPEHLAVLEVEEPMRKNYVTYIYTYILVFMKHKVDISNSSDFLHMEK